VICVPFSEHPDMCGEEEDDRKMNILRMEQIKLKKSQMKKKKRHYEKKRKMRLM
jgi:hypothetical protein